MVVVDCNVLWEVGERRLTLLVLYGLERLMTATTLHEFNARLAQW